MRRLVRLMRGAPSAQVPLQRFCGALGCVDIFVCNVSEAWVHTVCLHSFRSLTSYARVLWRSYARGAPDILITPDARTSSVFEKCLMCVLCDAYATSSAHSKSLMRLVRVLCPFFCVPFFRLNIVIGLDSNLYKFIGLSHIYSKI